ncbi:MAG: hypothetical protein P8011_03480 [Acidihalobacter sp.]
MCIAEEAEVHAPQQVEREQVGDMDMQRFDEVASVRAESEFGLAQHDDAGADQGEHA